MGGFLNNIGYAEHSKATVCTAVRDIYYFLSLALAFQNFNFQICLLNLAVQSFPVPPRAALTAPAVRVGFSLTNQKRRQ